MTYLFKHQDWQKHRRTSGSEVIFPGVVMVYSKVCEQKRIRGKPWVEYHFTVYKNDTVLVWIVTAPQDSNQIRLKTRFLSEETDQRLSERIFAVIENWIRFNGFMEICVFTAYSGTGFYESLGYVPVDEDEIESGVKMYKMTKSLKSDI